MWCLSKIGAIRWINLENFPKIITNGKLVPLINIMPKECLQFFHSILNTLLRISSQLNFSPKIYDFWTLTNICICRSSSTYKPLADRPNKVLIHLFWNQTICFFILCIYTDVKFVTSITSSAWVKFHPVSVLLEQFVYVSCGFCSNLKVLC